MNHQNRALLRSVGMTAATLGLKLETNDPGDGLRIRIFRIDDPSDFFGPNDPITTIFYNAHKNRETIKMAGAWLLGFAEGILGYRSNEGVRRG